MRRLFSGIVNITLLLLLVSPLKAADISLSEGDGLDLIFISGEITESDVAHFQRLAVSSDEAVIVLESPGGSLEPALRIGEIVRLKGFYTYVPNGTTCTSSCALIWVAGQTRYLSQNARVGFHASYIQSGGRQVETGVGNAMVGRYLTLLNLPEKAVIFATSAAPNEIRWINTANSTESGIAFEILDLEGEANTTGPSPQANAGRTGGLVGEFEWQREEWSVRNFSARTGCYMIVEFTMQGDANLYSWLSVGVELSGSTYLAFHNERFKSVKDGQSYSIDIEFMTGDEIDDGWGTREFSGAVHDGGMKTLSTSLDWGSLEADMANEEIVFFSMDGEVIDAFPLKGSRQAVGQLKRCLASGSNPSDPFAR